MAGSPFVLEDIHGVSPQLFSVLFALNAAGIVAASQISRSLVGRLGPARDHILGKDAARRIGERHLLRPQGVERCKETFERFGDGDHGARKTPEAPPDFSRRRMSVMRMARSTALHMS